MVSNQEAMRAFFKIARDIAGNVGPMPGIYPDYAAPIVRNGAAGRGLAMARWGMPTPQFALEGKKTDAGQCHVNFRADGVNPRRVMSRKSCRVSGAGLLLPDLKRLGTDCAIGVGRQSVSAWLEVAIDERVSGEEVLGLFGRFEPLHLSLSSPGRPV